MRRLIVAAFAALAILAMTFAVYAEDKPADKEKPAADKEKAADVGKTVDEVTKESIDKCKETAKTKPTVKMIMENVGKACKLVEKEGEAAFPKFKGKDSEFIFAGTYIWIHTMKTPKMIMHPTVPKMEGKDVTAFKDKNNKAFFAEMNTIVKKDGAGWVEYYWPKPGAKEMTVKVSYVKGAKYKDTEYVVGCGVYDMTLDQVKKELEKVKAEKGK